MGCIDNALLHFGIVNGSGAGTILILSYRRGIEHTAEL